MRNRLLKAGGTCLLTILFSAMCFIGALANGYDLFELEAIGVMKDLPQHELNDNVSRDVFSRIAINISGYGQVTSSSENLPFNDISDSLYASDITVLYNLGIVSGNGGGSFDPERTITHDEAKKIIVSILGYGAVLQSNSIEAYRMEASKLGIGLSVPHDAPLTYEQVYELIDQALDVNILEYNFNSRYSVSDSTLKDMLQIGKNDENLIHMRGVVTADASTYLYNINSSLEKNQIEIEGKIYNLESVAPIGFVGQEMEFYVSGGEDGDKNLITMLRPWKKTNIYEFESRYIDNVSASTISFYKSNDRSSKTRVKLSDTTLVIYNGRPEEIDLTKLNDMKYAEVKLIDNGDDNIADVVFITEYVYCVVNDINVENNRIYLEASTPFEGTRNLELDTEDEDCYVAIWDAYGNTLDINKIEAKNLLCISKSTDGGSLNIMVSDNFIEGTLNTVADDRVVVDGETYEVNTDFEGLTTGKKIELWTDMNGRAVVIKNKRESGDYAYVYKTYTEPSGEVGVTLIKSGDVEVKVLETENEDGGASTKTPNLVCYNDGLESYVLADKVKVNGARKSAADAVSEIIDNPVIFKTDNNGKINAFEFPETISNDVTKTYNGYELTFGKSAGTAFGIESGTTSAICIPTNSDATKEDLKTSIELINGVSYTVTGYELDTDTQLAGLLLVKAEMRSGIAGSISASSDVAMVKSVDIVLDDDEEEALQITLLEDGEDITYNSAKCLDISAAANSIERGSLIAYSLDDKNKLDNYEVLQEPDNYINFWLDLYSNNEKYCGEIKDIRYHYVSSLKGRWVNNITVGPYGENEIDTTYEFYERSPVPIYIITGKKNVETGSFDDIMPGDRVFVCLNIGVPRALVIKR